jgi:hypothetical protein
MDKLNRDSCNRDMLDFLYKEYDLKDYYEANESIDYLKKIAEHFIKCSDNLTEEQYEELYKMIIGSGYYQ